MPSVLVIGDLHAPFMHEHAVDFLADLKRQVKPDIVVQIGDELEGHRWSRHTQSPELPGPADELRLAREQLVPLFKLFPDVLLCTSNHTRRLALRAAEAALPAGALRTVKEIIGAPDGWRWADWWDVDGVQYRHGDGFHGKFGAMKAVERLRKSVCMGHLHEQAGVWYSAVQGGEPLVSVATGCLLDHSSPAFDYSRLSAGRPILGAAVIHGGRAAHFIPLPT